MIMVFMSENMLCSILDKQVILVGTKVLRKQRTWKQIRVLHMQKTTKHSCLSNFLEFRKYKHLLNFAFDSSGQNGHVYPTDQQLHWKSHTAVIHIHMREKTLEFIAQVLSRTKYLIYHMTVMLMIISNLLLRKLLSKGCISVLILEN